MHWKWPNKYVQVKISLSTVHSPVISVVSHSPNTAGCLNHWLWNRRWNNFWIKEASRKLPGDRHSQYYYPNPPHNGSYSIVRLFVHPQDRCFSPFVVNSQTNSLLPFRLHKPLLQAKHHRNIFFWHSYR